MQCKQKKDAHVRVLPSLNPKPSQSWREWFMMSCGTIAAR
jgi:hypothetical protein